MPIPLTVEPRGTISPPVVSYGIPGTIIAATSVTGDQTTSAGQEAAEELQLGATESRTLRTIDISSLDHEHPLGRDHSVTIGGRRTESPRNSKHGKSEKYFCPYPDCSHSQPGSGFCRKDHLDQHLRGPHKQSSVARVRAKPVAASNSLNPTATGEIAQPLSQSKKRKHGADGEPETYSVDELVERLAEERSLRLLREEEIRLLRQKLERYEARMEKKNE